MTTHDTNLDHDTTEGNVDSKKSLKNFVKKALIWGGAAVGLVAVTLIASNTRRTVEVLEEATVELDQTPEFVESVADEIVTTD